jgi:signal transduction histidine kinase
VLLNLLSNAVKYNNENGRITLNCEIIDKQRLRICVSDTGDGLSETEIEKLYMPYERLDADINIEGTGIGLVITNTLAELMGGATGVFSTKGEGSTFWVELALSNGTI